MSTERFECPICGADASITVNWCGPWRGYWVDVNTHGALGDDWWWAYHSLFRFTAWTYARMMRRVLLDGIEDCPNA